MCWYWWCPFQREDAESSEGDDITNILVFGATGMTGGAVMEAALSCAWFRISGFTRSDEGEVHEVLTAKGIDVKTGDMNKISTLYSAMVDCDCVFLNTIYWENMSGELEYEQGVNVVTAAMECGVKHLIYVGTDYDPLVTTVRCEFLEAKAKVEAFIVNSGIPYTIVRLGFYFENFISVFKPHQTGRNEFAIALPMGRSALNSGSVVDFGHCISKIALRPAKYSFRTVNLATSYLTVDDLVEAFNENIPAFNFYNPKIPLKVFEEFDFAGSEEIASIFAHYKSQVKWDQTLAYELNAYNKTVHTWIKDWEKTIVEVLMETPFDEPETSAAARHGDRAARGIIDVVNSIVKMRISVPNIFSRKGTTSDEAYKSLMQAQEQERHVQRSITLKQKLSRRHRGTILSPSPSDREYHIQAKIRSGFASIFQSPTDT